MGGIGVFSVEVAKQVKRHIDMHNGVPMFRDQRGRQSPPPDRSGITFINMGSATIPPYGLVRVDDSHDYDGFPIPAGVLPDEDSGEYHWLVNGSDPVEQYGIGNAQEGPAIIFLYDADTPAVNQLFGPESGAAAAVKDPATPLIRAIGVLNAEAKTARGFLAPPAKSAGTRLVTANETIAAEGGTGAVTVIEGDPGEEEPADDPEVIEDCVNDTSQELNEGDRAYLLPGDKYLMPTRCPT